jgi:hypothetical protein
MHQIKIKDDDSDSDECEEFCKISAMQSLTESLQSLVSHLSKRKD